MDIMTIAKEEIPTKVFPEIEPFKQVTRFKYLVSAVLSSGKIDPDIENRCNKADQVF